jgi:hypothetical protein
MSLPARAVTNLDKSMTQTTATADWIDARAALRDANALRDIKDITGTRMGAVNGSD